MSDGTWFPLLGVVSCSAAKVNSSKSGSLESFREFLYTQSRRPIEAAVNDSLQVNFDGENEFEPVYFSGKGCYRLKPN